jgi:hypothetical protein
MVFMSEVARMVDSSLQVLAGDTTPAPYVDLLDHTSPIGYDESVPYSLPVTMCVETRLPWCCPILDLPECMLLYAAELSHSTMYVAVACLYRGLRDWMVTVSDRAAMPVSRWHMGVDRVQYGTPSGTSKHLWRKRYAGVAVIFLVIGSCFQCLWRRGVIVSAMTRCSAERQDM